MSIKNKTAKTVKEFNAAEKKKQLEVEIEKDKAERVAKFAAEIDTLAKKYNCHLMGQVIIEGDKFVTRVIPIAN